MSLNKPNKRHQINERIADHLKGENDYEKLARICLGATEAVHHRAREKYDTDKKTVGEIVATNALLVDPILKFVLLPNKDKLNRVTCALIEEFNERINNAMKDDNNDD